MPELPEVETTLRGIRPHVLGRRVEEVAVRARRLRLPVPELAPRLVGRALEGLRRRGKYLLFAAGEGHLLIHLGMSGSLRILPAGAPPGPHDHLDWTLEGGLCLRFTDPRRFGLVQWLQGDPLAHPLLAGLGPEPLGEAFTADYLYRASRGRRVAVKAFLMDGRVVAGVGNIYANEALHRAGIRPQVPAGRLSRARCGRLVAALREVLAEAVAQGGTTLRDFVGGDGRPGYFAQALRVYGRAGAPCTGCGAPLREVRLAGRSTVYCPRCQR